MSHKERGASYAASRSERSASSRSSRSRSSRSRLSKGAEHALLEAATKKVELECRIESLKLKQALDRKEQVLRQQKEQIELQTELNVEEAKISTLEQYEGSAKGSLFSGNGLPKILIDDKLSVSKWLEENHDDKVDQPNTGPSIETEKQVTCINPTVTTLLPSNTANEVAEHDNYASKLQVTKKDKTMGLFTSSETSGAGIGDKRTIRSPHLEQSKVQLIYYSPDKDTYIDYDASKAQETSQKEKEITYKPSIHDTSLQREFKPSIHSTSPHECANVVRQQTDQNPTETTVLTILKQLTELQQQSTLPKSEIDYFDGSDELAFPTFIKNFEALVNKTTDTSRKFELLLKYTKGEAKTLIKDCILINSSEEAYNKAMKLLKITYGHPATIASAYQVKATNWPKLRPGDKDDLRKFAMFVTGLSIAKLENPHLTSVDGFEFLRTLAEKLHVSHQETWKKEVGKYRDKYNRPPYLEDFEEFVGQLSRNANDPRTQGLGYQAKGNNSAKHHPSFTPRRSTRAAIVQAKEELCVYCKERHKLQYCKKLVGKPLNDRLKVLKELKVCFGCLKPGSHTSRQCNRRLTCQKCTKSHPTMLHQEQPQRQQQQFAQPQRQQQQFAQPQRQQQQFAQPQRQQQQSAQPQQSNKTNNVCGLTGAGVKGAYPNIIPVVVRSRKTGQTAETYAFLDEGSDIMFCSKQLQAELGVQGKQTKMEIATINKDEVIQTEILQSLEISGLDRNNFIELPDVYTQYRIPASKEDVVCDENISSYEYLQDVTLGRLLEDDSYVGLLIGNNLPEAFEPQRVINSYNGGPYAVKTMLGWSVHGLERDVSRQVNSVNRIKIIQPSVEAQLEKLYNAEFTERVIHDQPERSILDKEFMDKVEASVKYTDGHFEVPLPLKNQDMFPNNYNQAEMRLRHLKRKLMNNAEHQREYRNIIKDMIDSKFVEEVPDSDLERSDGMVWYVPHHSVVHPQKGKVRVVFDCAATHRGRSLNSSLLQGPNLTSNLVGVLLRFRQHEVAVMGDVTAMFHQVRVPEADRDLMRFLWWTDGDLNQPIKQYRMCVHPFGATSSPSCANFALRRAADRGRKKYGEEAYDTVMRNFYVDDCLKSLEEEDEAVQVVGAVRGLLKESGFALTKWLSNSRKVLMSVPQADRAQTVRDLDVEEDGLPMERVLGLLWSSEDDKFRFQINMKEKPCTRRGILSTVSAIYDPLGFASPVILPAKQILQSLCKEQLSWDDEIPLMYKQVWEKWQCELPKLAELKVNRCMKPASYGELVDLQLHHFSDASQSGYGTVSYLRSKYVSGEVYVALILAKSRVAPLKQISIPRLELSASTVAVRVNHQIQQELDLKINSTHYWTDSMTVLRYIENKSARFHTFVANRINIIHDGSNPNQWHYVESERNPADDCSRGLSITKFLESERFHNGPPFLWQEEACWPRVKVDNYEDLQSDPEVKKKPSINAVSSRVKEVDDVIQRLIQHYSSWYRLKKAVAWLLKVKKHLLKLAATRSESKIISIRTCAKKNGDDGERGEEDDGRDEEDDGRDEEDDGRDERDDEVENITYEDKSRLSVLDLQQAEDELIKYAQGKQFSEEIEVLKKGLQSQAKKGQGYQIKKSSSIYRLNPQLKKGILIVGGRIKNAEIPERQKFPVIIPKNSSIANMILHEIHEQSGHGGRNQMLTRLHEKYWIPSANAASRKIIRNCVTCRRRNACVQQQMMSDLPQDRVTSEEPPFTRVGIDFFGPFDVKQGRSIVKRYGVVFICLASKAVHIERAESLNTDACINVLRRFISRRGQVKQIRSDNGTNFVSANKELQREISLWNQEKIHDYLLQNEVDWIFNPPGGSHHGGIWERQIRSIRKVMRSVIREQVLTDDALHTLLCEIEAIINSRPITTVSIDESDPGPLTPNHLLQLKNACNLPPTVSGKLSQYAKRRWRQVQYLADLFWHRWKAEYLPQLQQRQRWINPQRNTKVGDIVLVVNESTPRNVWPLARVIEVYPADDGLVRRVKVKTKANASLIRPIDKLVLLLEADIPEEIDDSRISLEESRSGSTSLEEVDDTPSTRPKRVVKPVKRLDL